MGTMRSAFCLIAVALGLALAGPAAAGDAPAAPTASAATAEPPASPLRLIRAFGKDVPLDEAPEEHTGAVEAIAFAPDGGTAFSGSHDHSVKMWNVATGRLLWPKAWNAGLIQGAHVGSRQAFSRDCSLVLTQNPPGAISLQKREFVQKFDATVERQRIESDSSTYSRTDYTSAAALSRDGRSILTGNEMGTLRLWSLATGECVTLTAEGRGVSTVAFAEDGRRVVSGNVAGAVEIWGIEPPKRIRVFDGHRARVNDAEFSPGGARLLTGDWAGLLKLWDVESGKELWTTQAHGGAAEIPGLTAGVWCLAFSPDGQRALTGGVDHTIKLWDLNTGRELGRFSLGGDRPVRMAFHPSGRSALVGTYSGCRVLHIGIKEPGAPAGAAK